MTNLLKEKILISAVAVAIAVFLIYNISNLTNNENLYEFNSINNSSNFIEDEIEPLCRRVKASNYEFMKLENIDKINISIKNLDSWYQNLLETLETDPLILDKNKKRFNADLEVNYNSGVKCIFKSKIRISGDYQDHIRLNFDASLDVSLDNGNIGNIVDFKLFLPETRRDNTEYVITAIMQNLNFLTPRTHSVDVSMNGQKAKPFIFQEKATKEFLEYNSLRESTILETSEEFYWENRKLTKTENPVLFGKILNTKWTNSSPNNIKISVKALDEFNKLIFQSDFGYLKYDYTQNPLIQSFDTALFALDGHHGLFTHNRKFYYDNFNNKLIPIYYDADSQIASRETDIKECTLSKKTEYSNLACINGFPDAALDLLQKINFSSGDIYQQLVDKNIEVEKIFVDEIFDKFISNLNSLSALKQQEFQQTNNYYEKFKTQYLNDSSIDSAGFYFLDYKTSKAQFCNFNLLDCRTSEEKLNNIENIIKIDSKDYYFLGSGKISNTENNTSSNLNLLEDVNIKSLNGKASIAISRSDQKILINITDDTKLIFYGSGTLKNWDIEINGNQNREESKYRQDENSITGCVTFLNLAFENINISSKNNKCEDGINFINTKGTVDKVLIRNTSFDGLDIDYSELSINKIEIYQSGNDCLDISYSQITIEEVISNHCSDKGVSIGEKSKVKIGLLSDKNSNATLGIKDSSEMSINKFRSQQSNMCIAMYRKKQEFGPSILEINDYECLAQKENFIQSGQGFYIEK